MADVASTFAAWSSTTGSNSPAGTATIGNGVDDNLREIQGVIVRALSHKGADIASSSTIDVGALDGLFHDVTGTSTISGLGTVRTGIWKILKFEGALTLTHNSTSLILPGAANITTADGDIGIFFSEGSGNWRCISYFPASGSLPFVDSSVVVIGSSDKTKKVRFEVDGLTTATTRVITVGDRDFAIGKLPTIQVFTSGSGTYTTPSGATRLWIRMVGGGGGGAGGGFGAGNGGDGGSTTFSTLTAAGGAGGAVAAGGGGTGGAGTNGDVNLSGQSGHVYTSLTTSNQPGGDGGASVLGHGGWGTLASTGTTGMTPGGGGGGGGINSSADTAAGSGGGGGAYVEKTISSPSATYSYAVGSGGASGAAGTNGSTGGNGATGVIIVHEFYD